MSKQYVKNHEYGYVGKFADEEMGETYSRPRSNNNPKHKHKDNDIYMMSSNPNKNARAQRRANNKSHNRYDKKNDY